MGLGIQKPWVSLLLATEQKGLAEVMALPNLQ